MDITCKEMVGKTSRYSIDKDGVITWSGTRKFQVLSDTELYGFESVAGLPAANDAHPGNANARVSDVSATEAEKLEDGSWVWDVTVSYTSHYYETSTIVKNEIEDDPIDWAPVWSGWRAEQYTVSPNKDLDNKPFVNSAGDRFSNAPTITVWGASNTVTKNYTSFSGAYALSLIGKCNADSFLGATNGQLLITDIVPTEKSNGTTTYVEVAVTIKYNPLKWDEVEILDIGPRCVDLVTGQLKFLEDANGNVSTEPTLLNGYGFSIFDTDVYETVPDPNYIKFRVCDSISFNALGLI